MHSTETVREAARAPNTRRAYASEWTRWCEWCDEHGHPSLPARPEALERYLIERAAKVRVGSLRQCLGALKHLHEEHGFAPPGDHPGVRRRRVQGDR